MDKPLILRVVSAAGRSRVEMTDKSTFKDLKTELQKRLNIDPKTVALFLDQTLKKRIVGSDLQTLV